MYYTNRRKAYAKQQHEMHARQGEANKSLTERYTIGTNAGIGTTAHTRWKHEHRKGDNFVAAPSMQTS